MVLKFCCVTPCYNAEAHIEQTLKSVLSQTVFKDRSNQLHYIVKDGGSTDKTIQKVKQTAFEYNNYPNINIEIISQADTGMYDALATSFRNLPEGNVYSYINAGDYYSLFAFEIVAEIFKVNDVQFLTGLSCVYNEKNHLISCHLPYKYKKSLMLAGCYGTILPHVQQESTFWGPKLQRIVDLESLRNTRLAGDYLLWKTFIGYEPLYIVSAHLGGFKIHKGQLTENSQIEYKNEVRQIADSSSLIIFLTALVYKICWLFPNKLKKILSKNIFYYEHLSKVYKVNR
ncbi:glycosyltransferase [Desulfopila sp. IMCC35006]|uniref:glycosyltransferase n=1 Tax=Desulfopila sp. IMCC35006 TaxID=2569542 RepID=UPI0010AD47D8|nr:glycosyltransferase [Desulfopila sp. IMCC35006]TKB26460.1 glycosyltransferase [Desulfopila sp. IMCC35006]